MTEIVIRISADAPLRAAIECIAKGMAALAEQEYLRGVKDGQKGAAPQPREPAPESPAPARVAESSPVAASGQRAKWATPQRVDALNRMYPAGIVPGDIVAALVKLGGPDLPPWKTIQVYAIQTLHLHRPAKEAPATKNKLAKAVTLPREPPDTTTPIRTDADTIRARAAAWGLQFNEYSDLDAINAHARRIGHRPFALETRR